MYKIRQIVDEFNASFFEMRKKMDASIEKCTEEINAEGGKIIDFKVERIQIAREGEAEKVIIIFIYEVEEK